MCGMFDGTDGNTYDICIPSPFVRDSKSEAMKDECFAYRFASFDAEGSLLIVFDEEYFEATEENGKKVVFLFLRWCFIKKEKQL